MSVWFITGASRGFGAEITRSALAAGHQVAAVEEASDAAVRAVYETNVFGTLNVLRAVLPVMRAQRSGRIVNISSIGGFVGSPGWGIYNSTKFALEGISEALAREVAPLGVTVTIVEPGYFRTDFLDASSLHTEASVIEDYAETAGATRARAAQVNHAQPGDPAKAAAAIERIASADRPPLRIQLGRDSLTAIADKLTFVTGEQQAWHDLSVSTDHDDVASAPAGSGGEAEA
jgi:NAD(P)-dependent dehydrogenase (short-subunit alcohol dehydrogenase family)